MPFRMYLSSRRTWMSGAKRWMKKGRRHVFGQWARWRRWIPGGWGTASSTRMIGGRSWRGLEVGEVGENTAGRNDGGDSDSRIHGALPSLRFICLGECWQLSVGWKRTHMSTATSGLWFLDSLNVTAHPNWGSDSDADAQHCRVLSLYSTRQCQRSIPACIQ